MFSRGWHGVADVWVGNNEPMEWTVAKLSCLSPTVLNPHFPGALLITLRIKTSRWCSRHTCHVPLGWADSNSADSSMFFFLRGNLQLFPELFPWNLQLSSRFFLKPLQWSLHPHICPLYSHYIPIASTKTHHFPPLQKKISRRPGVRILRRGCLPRQPRGTGG